MTRTRSLLLRLSLRVSPVFGPPEDRVKKEMTTPGFSLSTTRGSKVKGLQEKSGVTQK